MESRESNTAKVKILGGSAKLVSVKVRINYCYILLLYYPPSQSPIYHHHRVRHFIISIEFLKARVAVAGIALTPFTGGLSMTLTAAGVGMGITGTGMVSGSDMYKDKNHRKG